MSSVIILLCIFLPFFIIFTLVGKKIKLDHVLFFFFIIASFFIYIIYVIGIMIYMFFFAWKLRRWFDDGEKFYTLKLYYENYVLYIEYWYYLILYVNRFVSSILFSILYFLYYIIFLRILYSTGTVHIYYFIIEYSKFRFEEFYTDYNFNKFTNFYFNIKNVWMYCWSGVFVNNRVPFVGVGYNDNSFKDNIYFKYGEWIRYPSYRGTLLFVEFSVKKIWYVVYILVYLVELIRYFFYVSFYKKDIFKYYVKIINILNVKKDLLSLRGFLQFFFRKALTVSSYCLYIIEVLLFNLIYIGLFIGIKALSFCIVCFFKYYKIFLFIFFFFFLLNYTWLLSYFFRSLYNHYVFNLPWSLSGGNLRFLNFFSVDKRNFYFLVDFANKLSDYVGVIDKNFYIKMHKDFISSLNSVFFTINKGILPIMYNNETYLNRDTLLLRKLFKKYDQSMSIMQWRNAKFFRRSLKRFYMDGIDWGVKFPDFYKLLKNEFYVRLNENYIKNTVGELKWSDKIFNIFVRTRNKRKERILDNYLRNFDINSGPYIYRLSENLFYNFFEDDEFSYSEAHENLSREDFAFTPKDTWALIRGNVGKGKRSFIIRANYEKIYDSNLLKFYKSYKDLWKEEVVEFDDGTEYLKSLVEDANGYLGYGFSVSKKFYDGFINYMDNFYYNFKLVFNLNPKELNEFSKCKIKKSSLSFNRLVSSPKINEIVFHEARPQEQKGALVDDVLEEWAEPNMYKFIRKGVYKRKHVIRKYPFRVNSMFSGKSIVVNKLKKKIPLILNKFIQKRGFMDISHEYARYKRVALELNNIKKVELADLKINTLLYNYMNPEDIREILSVNDNLDEADKDYLKRKLFHFWSYRHYMRCRSLAIKFMKYVIYYDKVILSNYGRWSEYFMDANPPVQIEIVKHRRLRGLLVHEDTLERLEAYMEHFDELLNKWKKCRMDLEGTVKSYKHLKKVVNFKKKIYRKIYDLKKYSYVRSLRKSGNTIVKYLQSFSLDYHFNHLLWHSPFRAGLNWCRKHLEISSNIDTDNIFIFKYFIKDKKRKIVHYIDPMTVKVKSRMAPKWKIVKVLNYSFVFNFKLNCVFLDERLGELLTHRISELPKFRYIYKDTFTCLYNYGNFRYKDLSFFDYFRVMCAIFRNYYNSYIYNLYRWSYVMKEKNYGLYYFINKKWTNVKKRWSNYKRWYLRLTMVREFYNKWRPWKKWRLVDTLRYDRYKFRFIPWFLIYSYYPKCFVDYLMCKYFVKDRFLYWWLDKRLNISVIDKVYLKIYSLKYVYIYKINYLNRLFSFLSVIKILNRFKLICWYFGIVFKCNMFLKPFYRVLNCEIFSYNYILLVRFYIVRILYFVKWCSVSFNLELKGDMLDNWVDTLTMKNVVKGFFNIRGVDMYIKDSDDYFRRGKRMKRIRRRRVHAYPFWRAKSTVHQNYLVRRKKLFFLFNSIYMYSLRNLYFVYNDINISNLLSLVFCYEYFSNPILSVKLYGLGFIKYYYLVYIGIFVFVHVFYIRFYNIFFPRWEEYNNIVETSHVRRPEDIWNNVKEKSVSYFLTRSSYYIQWLYRYYFGINKPYPFKELHMIKDSVIYKFVEQSKNVDFSSLLYYDPDCEYQEIDKGSKSIIMSRILKVTTRFIKYLNTVNRLIFNNKMYIFSENYGVYKNMKKKIGNDEISYEFFIDYGFGVFFLCFFYWFLFIPGFFLSFLVRHLYYSSYGKFGGAYRVFCVIRCLIGDFTIVHNVCKFLEGPNFIHRWGFRKQPIDSTYMKMLWRRKRRKRYMRFLGKIASVYYNMLPLGGYYQWFHKLNYMRYSINFLIFYIKSSLLSNCYNKVTIIVIIIYISLFVYLYKKKLVLFKSFNIKIYRDSYLYYVYSLFSYLHLKKHLLIYILKNRLW